VKETKAKKAPARKAAGGPRKTPAALPMTPETAFSVYRTMVRIRRFETSGHELYLGGKIPGMSPHLYIGEEAVASSISHFLTKEDYIVSNHRGHGHILAKGASMDRMLAEIQGKSTGYCRGRGGSMHIADVSLNNLGANGIVAAGIPIAVGAALSIVYRGTDQISVVYFGDAASNQGAFHEAVNMAAAMKLPVLLVCENNQYGLSTSIKTTNPTAQISDKAHGYGIEHATVDGMDLEIAFAGAKIAVEYVRRERRPYLIEFDTYRFLGHGASDNRSYRTKEEEERWKKRSPIENFRPRMISVYGIPEEKIAAMEAEVEKEVAHALKFAAESPEPPADEVLEDVYYPTESVRQAFPGRTVKGSLS
jgi:TPP-dependent pyruvate/acetoin dehydrogenase alpha subunit